MVYGRAARSAAAPLEVGPNKTYATPCAAIAAAKPDDEIEIAPGTYTDSCTIGVAGLTLRGSGGQPKIDLSGSDHPAQYKGIYVVSASDVTLENLELTGAHIGSDNGLNAAGIRVEAPGLTVRGCNIHDNQNGILGGTSGVITIEHTEFFNNGLGDGCNQGGCTHNVYIANIDTLYFQYNWSHHVATDTSDKGHLLKSRAKTNYVLYNRLSGEDGFDSYEIDLPNGGLAIVLGNVIQKGKLSGNGTSFSWGEEGASNADKRVFVVNNTFVAEGGSARFVNAAGATLVLHNNLFAGGGSVGNGGTLSADNWSGADPGFIDRAHFDYHLEASSAVLGRGVDPGRVDQFSLTADHEYVAPLGERARASIHDLGAFEFGAGATSAPGDAGPRSDADAGTEAGGGAAGSPRGSGGAGPARGGGGALAAGAGGADTNAKAGGAGGDSSTRPSAQHAGGCGCAVAGAQHALAPGWYAAALALGMCLRRRRICGRARSARDRLALLALLLVGSSCSSSHSNQTTAAREDAAVGERAAAGKPSTAVDAAVKRTLDAGMTEDAGRSGRRDAATSSIDASKPPSTGGASTGGGGKLCPELGWCELMDTKLAAVCPDRDRYAEIQANEGCGGVIDDWSGGIGDTRRNRLVIWGGGHRGYFGNEVYALDLEKVAMLRLNEPSDVSGVDLTNCTSPEAYADGRPGSRHTYDGLAYLPDDDKLFSLGGAGIPCGYAVTGTWTLDLATVDSTPLGAAAPWKQMKPDPFPTKATYGVIADYDPNSKRLIVDDTYNLWSYDLARNQYTLLNDSNQTDAHLDYHMTGRVDPKRKLFIAVGGNAAAGGGMQVFDLGAGSNYAQQNWTEQVSGCDQLLSASSPGFAYDAEQDRLIGWAGGDSVFVFDPDAKHCTAHDYAGGPSAQPNGTFGRFRYFPAHKLFAVVNAIDENAYTLRLVK